MTRIVYVNGQYQRYADAAVHAEDRGFQFGDAVYEVCEVRDGCLVDERRHLSRLARSLDELTITQPMSDGAWRRIMRETIRRNRVHDGLVYLQVSRGAGPRNFLFSGVETPPTVVCLARNVDRQHLQLAATRGIRVITHAEIRWARCDIKTVMLLPASLAKEKAHAQGAQEVWFVDREGCVLEGGSSNAWIVTHSGEIITRPVDTTILRGVTRMTLIDLLHDLGLQFKERAFSVAEALEAKEAFVTSAVGLVMPVVCIDDRMIGEGLPGAITQRLRNAFNKVASISSR
ncbi:MAG: D-amino-acid transaminase [Pseudomonadota bacterium]